jgi:hypothetical protein
MSKRTVIGVALCGAIAILVGGALYASNMGFKLNYQLANSGTASGTNTIALPWNRQVGIDDAFDLIQDINSTGTPTNGVERIERWLPATNAVLLYSGAPTDPAAFSLVKAEGYWVKVSTDVAYVIVGSHDPGYTVQFLGSSSSASGTNFYAPPYHSTAADGLDLINDINSNGVPPNSVERLEYWLPATNSRLLYSGAPTDAAAPGFVPGQAVFAKVGTNNVSYNASHY